MLDVIDDYVRGYLEESGVPGLAIALARGGETIFQKGYGVRRLSAPDPVTPSTLFHLASVVKTMTSTAIMQLREAGRLELDDPVVRHLPYFRVDDPRSDKITIRQCLSHTSGIGHPDDYGWDDPEFDDGALERHVRSLVDHQLLDLEPGTSSYSDIAYNVLGDVIAKVSGMSYEAYVQRHLFAPLGMRSTTTMAPREGDPALLALGYEKDESDAVRESDYPYNRMHVPCGCVASNVFEMTRYATAHLNRGVLDGERILQEASYEDMWTVHAQGGGPGDPALGWRVRGSGDELTFFHPGADDGFTSYFGLWPPHDFSVVVLCNADWGEPWVVGREVYALAAADLE